MAAVSQPLVYIRPYVVVVAKLVYTFVLLENLKDSNVLTCSMVE